LSWPGVEHTASRRVRPSGVPSIGFWRVLTAASLVDHSAEALEKAFRATLEYFTKASCHVSPNPHLHRTPETDSRPPADPTSRMGRAKWRILHAPLGTAGRIDAKGIQRVYRCCSSRPRTGIKLNRHRSCWINQPRRKWSTIPKAGWSWGCVSAIDSNGRTTWIADAHRDNGKRFVVHADEKLTAFIELESAIRACELASQIHLRSQRESCRIIRHFGSGIVSRTLRVALLGEHVRRVVRQVSAL
jgi:hypothetical protein